MAAESKSLDMECFSVGNVVKKSQAILKSLAPLVPANCPICNAEFRSGFTPPGQRMKSGAKVFYKCGSSVIFKFGNHPGECLLTIKNCCCEENIKANEYTNNTTTLKILRNDEEQQRQ